MAKIITSAALDIGTSAVKVLVGEKKEGEEQASILAQKSFPCLGMRNGEVFSVEEVTQAVLEARRYIDKTGLKKIKKVLVNINGAHTYVLSSQGLVSVSRADQKISEEDVERVFRACEAVNLPSNKEVLDVYPLEFIVDGERGIEDPVGLNGIRLEAKVLLVCSFSPVRERLENTVLEGGFEIEDIIPSPMASARAVLSEQQKELGVAVVDIGAGTTSLAVFSERKLRHFVIFPVGSSHITNDIAIGLRTEIATAERIKKEFGSIFAKRTKGAKNKIEIPDKSLSFTERYLRSIIEPRVSQIFGELQKEIKKINKHISLPAGVVFTGGGSLLPHLVDFAKKKLALPCYLGTPKHIIGLEDPCFSVCAGLLFFGFDAQEQKELSPGKGIKEKIKHFFEIFIP